MSAWFAKVQQSFVNDFIVDDRWKYIVSGLRITILVTILALLIGLALGVVTAMIRSTHDQTNPGWLKSPGSFLLKLANAICKLYITVIRGTPTLVQLLIMNFIVLLSSTKVTVAVITFGINSGAYVAEIIRGGIMGVDSGQMEAGRSLGLSYVTTMKDIVLPQAMKSALPALINEMITLLKDTSLVSVIALRDVTKQAQNIVSNTYQAYVPYVSLAIIYLVLVIILTKLLGIFERRLRESDRR